MQPISTTTRTVLSLLALASASAVASADINGFGNFSGFTINQAASDTGAPSTVSIPAGSITLTNTGSNEARSIFATTPQAVGNFTASFTYQASNIGFNFNFYQGMCFVIQNSPTGAAAVGSNGGLGYLGIGNSLGVAIALRNQGTPLTMATIGKNGALPTPESTAPVTAFSGNPINVLISYNGSLLHQQLTDTVTQATWSTDYVLNPSLSTLIGSSTAYVGFTAGTVAGVNQTISNFQFTSVPTPAAGSLLAVGGLAAVRRRRLR